METGRSWTIINKTLHSKPHIIDVQPIRDKKDLESMKWALKRFCGERDYILFLLGINSGLRVGDMLKIKTAQIRKKKEIKIKEGKTGKPRTILLSNIYEELNEYADTLESTWLFPSRKGDKPITTVQAWRQLQKASEMAELNSIGTHTMRKTFGYWFYKATMDIAKLQTILNHSHPAITLRYIGITDEQIEKSLEDFKL